MPTIRWLHFSDIHFNIMGTETEIIREKLLEYLHLLNVNFDFAFCTGDIRNAPDCDYPINSAHYIKNVLSSINVEPTNLFIVPGNHDIERDITIRITAIDRLQNDPDKKYIPEQGIIKSEDLHDLKSGRDQYYSLLSEIYDKDKSRIYFYKDNENPHFLIERELLNIVHVDSTLFYKKGNENNLFIGNNSLLRIIEKCNPKKPTIVITHYSFDQMDRREQNQIISIFRQYHVKLWLSGHEHEDIIRWQRDTFVEAQSGNLVFGEGTAPGIIVGTLNTENGEGTLQVHRWNTHADWALYQTLALNQDDKTTYKFSIKEKAAIKETKNKLPNKKNNSIIDKKTSSEIFYMRLTKYFPGISSYKEFRYNKAIGKRLEKLLLPTNECRINAPFWWFRGNSNLHIRNFRTLWWKHALMDDDELVISKIIVANTGTYWKSFIYVECLPQKQTRLYKIDQEAIGKMINEFGHAYEEYGLWHFIKLTRKEHDDGAFERLSLVIQTKGKQQLRVRYLSKYNFLITANENSINNHAADGPLGVLLNGMLKGDYTFSDLYKFITRLPRIRGID
jgi:predicted MPP superfamily phosphohydrolase